ncbi:MAG TPA: ATP-binding protein [Syntrophobacteraceae bacterium]|nr:ATP-binding protein [Syntrophobacteraceae bacterium]
MRWSMPFPLNIRQKVMVGLTVILLVVISIGTLSYRYLREIERKQHFVEVADDLSNIILEMRRYEKNYLLYGSREDVEENRRYVLQGKEVLKKMTPEAREFQAGPLLIRLEQELWGYGALMQRTVQWAEGDKTKPDPRWEEQLREHGKSLVDLSQEMVRFERRRILKIIQTLKTQLLASLAMSALLGVFLIPVVAHKIIRPLRTIENTTHRIARGEFSPLPVPETPDETQQVVQAFNRMVVELEKHQDQLVQAKKLSSLGTLTSGIAHQLNNPLNNISTSCQILLEELNHPDSELMRRMLGNIEQEVHRARDIVRGLLEFSRMREFCLAPTSLPEVVERSIGLISSQIPPRIEVVADIPPDLSLSLDAQRMQQVFLNLIENAIQAMEPPGQIRITAGRVPEEGAVLISVADTGKGIPEGLLGRIFDPFFTTKEVGVGTGLGLSVVYGIIQKHGGTISVESKPGEGSRFIIRLPAETVC